MTAFRWGHAEVEQALGLPATASGPAAFARVVTDTRRTAPGDLFVALVGDRFDGHDYLKDAAAAGALGAVVLEGRAAAAGAVPSRFHLYAVPDTLVALGALASHRRRALGARVVGITGSSGKTTTKDLTAAVLGTRYRTHATEGNHNNRIGLPWTVLAAPDDTEVLVLEMGTNEPGEIATLAALAGASTGVVTTVGETHLEKLGTVQGVLEEKIALIEGLPADGWGLVGSEPPELAERARGTGRRIRVAAPDPDADADLTPEDPQVDADGRWSFRWRGHPVRLRIPGPGALVDALLALGVGEIFDVPASEATRAVASVEAGSMRMELVEIGPITVLVDCYNSNPQSLRSALSALQASSPEGRRVAVLGSMLELGATELEIHSGSLLDALARGLDLVVATGRFEEAAQSLIRAGHLAPASPAVRVEADPGALSGWLPDALDPGDRVLLKASRGVELERVLPALRERFEGRAPGGGG